MNLKKIKVGMLMVAFMLTVVGTLTAGFAAAQESGTTDWQNATLFGVSVTVMLLIAGFLLVITWLMPDVKRRYGTQMKVVAIGLVAASIFAVYGVGLTTTVQEEPIDQFEWTATMTDNATFIIWPSQYAATWYVDYNSNTSNIVNATGSATFTLAVSRTDVLSAWGYGKAEVVNIGYFTDPSTGIEYPIIAKGTDGLFEADWTVDGNTYNLEVTLPRTEAKSDSANLTVTLNAAAFDGMTVGQGASFDIVFEDFTWTITPTLRNIATS